MAGIAIAFCPNEKCIDYGLKNHGNIGRRGKYGKEQTGELLYCRTCGKRFAPTRLIVCYMIGDRTLADARRNCPG